MTVWMRSMWAVSYTHLDVYKRQGFARAVLAHEGVDGSGSNLEVDARERPHPWECLGHVLHLQEELIAHGYLALIAAAPGVPGTGGCGFAVGGRLVARPPRVTH